MVDQVGTVRVAVEADLSEFEKGLRAAQRLAARFNKDAEEAIQKSSSSNKKAHQEANAAAASSAKERVKAEREAAKQIEAANKEAAAARIKAEREVAAATKEAQREAAKATREQNAERVRMERESLRAAKEAQREAARAEREAAAVARQAKQETAKLAREAAAEQKRIDQELAKSARQAAAARSASERQAASAAKSAARDAERAAKDIERANKKANKETDKLGQAFRSASDSAAFITGPLGGVASRITLLGNALRLGYAGVLAFSLGFGGLVLALQQAINEAERAETSFLRTQAVLKATGNSSGFTAEQIRAMGREITLSTLATSEGVDRAAQKLLTFRAVQGSVFREALALSQDLAAVGFGSIDAAAVQLGKALQDPVVGLESLREVGVTFSAVQREQIRNFAEAGRVAEAHRLVLQAVREQVGGAGESEAGGLTGSYSQLNKQISLFFKNIGDSGPLETWTGVINRMADGAERLNKMLFADSDTQLDDLIGERIKLEEGVRLLQESEKAQTPLTEVIIKRDKERIAVLNTLIESIYKARIAEQNRNIEAEKSAEESRKKAEQDRINAENIEKNKKATEDATRAAEQLAKRRADSIDGLRDELEIITALEQAYVKENGSLEQLESTRESLKMITDLQFAAGSKEAAMITDLIQKRDALQQSIDRETESRREAAQAQKTFETGLEGVRDRTAKLDAEAKSLGMAESAAEAYRVEQELINETIKNFGSITTTQEEAIRKVAAAYGESSAKMEELRKQQEEAEKQADRMAEAQQRFQESLAEGLTDALFGAESASDAIRNLALELSKAAVQAQLLALIQRGMGQQNPDQGMFFAFGKSLAAGMAGGAGGAGGGTATGISSVMASRMHSGGTGGQDGLRMNVPSSTFIGAPRFHDGLKPNEFPAVLERGEEVIPKDKVGKSSGNVIVNQYIQTPDVNSFRLSKRQVAREAKKGMGQ